MNDKASIAAIGVAFSVRVVVDIWFAEHPHPIYAVLRAGSVWFLWRVPALSSAKVRFDDVRRIPPYHLLKLKRTIKPN